MTTNREDRIFQSEILFGLYNLKRKESVYEVGFGSGLKQGSVLVLIKILCGICTRVTIMITGFHTGLRNGRSG